MLTTTRNGVPYEMPIPTPPKPFPLPYRIGIDICSIARIRALLAKDAGQGKYLRRWGSKVFNRLEWNCEGGFGTRVEEYERRRVRDQALAYRIWRR